MPSPFTANLKHLYQRRALWFWYALIGFMLFPLVELLFDPRMDAKGVYSFFLLPSLIAGLLAASLQKEILSRPFSHVLPGHRRIPRRFILIVGVVVNALIGLSFLNYPGLTDQQSNLAVISAAAVGMTLYLFATLLTFSYARSQQLIGFPALLFIIAAVLFDIDVALEYCIVFHPFAGMLLCALVSAVAWKRLGNRNAFRRICGEEHVTIFNAWNWKKVQGIKTRAAARKLAERDRVRDLSPSDRFTETMRRYAFSGTARNVFGSLYEVLGRLPATTTLLRCLLCLPLFVLMIYATSGAPTLVFMLFTIPHIIGLQMKFPATFVLFLPFGRRERSLASLGVVAVITALVTAAALILVALSHALSPIMPEIVLKGHTYTFTAISIRPVFLVTIVVPLGFLIQIFFPDNFLKMLPFMAFILLWPWTRMTFAAPDPLFMVASIIATWTAFTLLLHHHCTRRSLLRRP